MLSVLIDNKLKIAAGKIFSKKKNRLCRNLSYLVVILIFLFGGYFFFYRIFEYLYRTAPIGPAIAAKVLSTSFLIFFAMLFMSNIVTSLSTFYRSDEVEFLMSKPLHTDSIFAVKLVENVFYSSWATLIAGIPIIIAFGRANYLSSFSYVKIFLALLGFILIPAGLGITILLILTRFFPKIGKRELVVMVFGVLVLFIGLYYKFGVPGGFYIPNTLDLNVIDRYVSNLRVISFPYLPSAWMVKVILAKKSTLFLLLILSGGFLSIELALYVSSRLYRTGWLFSQEGKAEAVKRKRRRFLSKGRFFLVEKDIKVFTRDARQWAQAVILIALLFVYVSSLRPSRIYFEYPFWKILLAFANLGFVGYILATLCVRFVFPSISLEGPSFWVLRSSPLSCKKFLFSKLITNLIVGIILAETLCISTNLLLGVNRLFFLLSVVSVFLFAVALVSISVGLGSMFPDFSERNPSKIASGPGGILTALISLGYVGLSITILAFPVHLYIRLSIAQKSCPVEPFILAGILLLIINSLAITTPILLGNRFLKRREF